MESRSARDATGGWLKPAHAVLMHGVLVLPLLAWLVSRTGWEERTQTRGLSLGIAVYALLVAATIVSVLRAA